MKRVSPVALLVAGTVALAGCAGSHASRPVASVRHDPTAAIEAARGSNPALFKIFPARPGKTACTIPAGGVAGWLKGTCRTVVTYPVTHGPYGETLVRFHESWGSRHSSSWIVIVRQSNDEVVATQLAGEVSPQMRYLADDRTRGVEPELGTPQS